MCIPQTNRIHRTTVQSTDSEGEPSLQTADKGKGKGVDPASVPVPGVPTSQRFAGLKDRIVSSLDNTFPEGDGCDQDNYGYLSRGETNLVSPFCAPASVALD